MGKQTTMARTTLILKTQMLSEYAFFLKNCNKYSDKILKQYFDLKDRKVK